LVHLEPIFLIFLQIGLLSCTFRQTNIIWALYAMGAGALRTLHVQRQIGTTQTPPQILYDPPAESISICSS
jgi:hypothetical protein